MFTSWLLNCVDTLLVNDPPSPLNLIVALSKSAVTGVPDDRLSAINPPLNVLRPVISCAPAINTKLLVSSSTSFDPLILIPGPISTFRVILPVVPPPSRPNPAVTPDIKSASVSSITPVPLLYVIPLVPLRAPRGS